MELTEIFVLIKDSIKKITAAIINNSIIILGRNSIIRYRKFKFNSLNLDLKFILVK